MKTIMWLIALVGGIKALLPTPGHPTEMVEIMVAGLIAAILVGLHHYEGVRDGKRTKSAALPHEDQARTDSEA